VAVEGRASGKQALGEGGSLGGAVRAGGGLAFSKPVGIAARRLSSSSISGRIAGDLNTVIRQAASVESSLSFRTFGAALGVALLESAVGDVLVSLIRRVGGAGRS